MRQFVERVSVGERQAPDFNAHAFPPFKVNGSPYSFLKILKDDFWARTMLYSGPTNKIIVKSAHSLPYHGLPRKRLTRFLARREMEMHERLSDLKFVPRLLACIDDFTFAREYVEGQTLLERPEVNSNFFDELHKMVRELHSRKIAYVDLNKRDNIVVGEDGLPHLIDFQISVHLDQLRRLVGPLAERLLLTLQEGDIYHVFKHKRRICPDLLRPGEYELGIRRTTWHKIYRFLREPYFRIRRRRDSRLINVPPKAPKGE